VLDVLTLIKLRMADITSIEARLAFHLTGPEFRQEQVQLFVIVRPPKLKGTLRRILMQTEHPRRHIVH
jgi:hypothetical protein